MKACQAFCRISTVIKECKCFDDDWEDFAFRKDTSLRPCRSPKGTLFSFKRDFAKRNEVNVFEKL